ncbi:MAG TPA: hypothetical protein VN132_15480 [Bdellovibrio sp.]|nr:hypothetical protein [Bdellovibrio sp.]
MRNLVVIALLIASSFANAQVCGRFSEPGESVLKESTSISFDIKKVAALGAFQKSHCFFYSPRGVRCDLTYDNKNYHFFFNEMFTKNDVDSGAVETYFNQWLNSNNGKDIIVNTYNTLFVWDNDYEDVRCSNWYEQLTYTLTIDGKESVILE